MIRIYAILLFCLIFYSLPILAQEPAQSAYLELDLKSDNTTVEVMSLPDSSLLLHTKTVKGWFSEATFEFTKYDHRLKKVWHTTADLDARSDYIHHYVEAPYLYIAFDKEDQQEYYFVKLNLSTGESSVAEYEIPAIDAIEEFSVLEGNYFVIGNDRKEYTPTLYHINPETNKISLLPSVYGNDSYFSDLLADSKQNRTDAILLESNGRVSHLQTKSFNHAGNLIGTYFTSPQRDKLLQQTEITPGDTLDKLLIGVYGSTNMNYVTGFYTMPLIQNNRESGRFYTILDLENPLSHLKERQENRIRKKEKNRIERRREPRLKFRMLLHELIPTTEGYVLAAEVYTTEYNNVPIRRPYVQVPLPMRDEEYKHRQVIVVAFNKAGELIWDNSFILDDIVTTVLEPVVEIAAAPDGLVVIAIPDEEEVIYRVMDRSNFIDKKTELELKGPNEGDKILGTSENGIISWYGSNFAAFGFHSVRSAAREVRDVFYINKISF